MTRTAARAIGPPPLTRITSSDEFRDYAQKNQWEITFRGAEDSRKFMGEQYDDLKAVMTELGLVKKP